MANLTTEIVQNLKLQKILQVNLQLMSPYSFYVVLSREKFQINLLKILWQHLGVPALLRIYFYRFKVGSYLITRRCVYQTAQILCFEKFGRISNSRYLNLKTLILLNANNSF